MYLTTKQHDQFRTLLMGFEIPYRNYIADVLISNYPTEKDLENALLLKSSNLQGADPAFLKEVFPKAAKPDNVSSMYKKFTAALHTKEVVSSDIDIPMVGALNIVTFSLTGKFQNLYQIFSSYNRFCDLADRYRYARNKLDHPGCRTLEDKHLAPVLAFVRDICTFLDNKFFKQKSKEEILAEVNALQNRKRIIPIEKNNLEETPYMDSRIVCRDVEISELKSFIYGNPEDLRKQHSRCVYGYGGVGKTALVIEVIKQVVQDIQDDLTTNEYKPEYMFFFSAKRRQLKMGAETGKITEQQLSSHFKTADELINLVHKAVGKESFKGYHKEGLIVIDNLESLSIDDRKKVKSFIELQTPAEMQFIITSRNSEEYESNKKLAGFEADEGRKFVSEYIEENNLDLELSDDEVEEILNISKGNTLVLVLCLRRLSKRLIDISGLKADFSNTNAWKRIRANIKQLAPNAYEAISDFMYKDTFEQIESVFVDTDLFYKVLKVFAIIPNEGIDLSTVCLLTEYTYPEVELAVDTLCNYLIIEKKSTLYSLNQFAETYIIQRFIPDAETYNTLSKEIETRQRKISLSLENLDRSMKERPELQKIINDWYIVTDSDKIAAADMYDLYGQAKIECDYGSKFKVQAMLELFIKKSEESERITAHPFMKYQKARILKLIDDSKALKVLHTDEINESYLNAIYTIKTVDQYSAIQNTKSYAALLWLYGQFLSDQKEIENSIRWLEEGKSAFELQNIEDQQYFQCITILAMKYLDYYLQDRHAHIGYLRRARGISRQLQDNRHNLGRAYKHAAKLKKELQKYGPV